MPSRTLDEILDEERKKRLEALWQTGLSEFAARYRATAPEFAAAHPSFAAFNEWLNRLVYGTLPGQAIKRSSEAGVEALFSAPGAVAEMQGGYTTTGIPALDVATSWGGSAAGTLAQFLAAQQFAGAGLAALGKAVPQAARISQLAPSVVRTAGRGAATALTRMGMQAALAPEEGKPSLRDVAQEVAFQAAAGPAGAVAGRALERAYPAIHPLVEAPIVGAAAAAGGGAAAYPFSGKPVKEYLKDMGPQMIAMAVLNTAMAAGSPSTWKPRMEFGRQAVRFRELHREWLAALDAGDDALANAKWRDLMEVKDAMYTAARRAKVPEDILGSRTDWTRQMEEALKRDLIKRGWKPVVEEAPKAQAQPEAEVPAQLAPVKKVSVPIQPDADTVADVLVEVAQQQQRRPPATQAPLTPRIQPPGGLTAEQAEGLRAVFEGKAPGSYGAKAAPKPYEGLTPGTPEWKRAWQEHPELQREMLEYAHARETRQEPVYTAEVEVPWLEMGKTYTVRYPYSGKQVTGKLVRILETAGGPVGLLKTNEGKLVRETISQKTWTAVETAEPALAPEPHKEVPSAAAKTPETAKPSAESARSATTGKELWQKTWTELQQTPPPEEILHDKNIHSTIRWALERMTYNKDANAPVFEGRLKGGAAAYRWLYEQERKAPDMVQVRGAANTDRITATIRRPYGTILVVADGSGYLRVSLDRTNQHAEAISKALAEGKPVPPEVLADYPDLAKQAQKAEAAKPAPLHEVAPVATGKTATAKTERGTAVDTTYAVVDAKALISSHDTALRPDPRFPAELQPRERARAASEEQITRIANKLEPEFLGESPKASEGAPIIGPDGVVESGNARVIALKRVYEEGKPGAEIYKRWLLDNAERFGLDKAAIERAEAPVLVRIRQTPVDREQFVREANEAAVAAMSATEQAMADAKKISGGLMNLFRPNDEGEIATVANRDFIRGFLDQVVGPTERGRYVTAEGGLSQEGIARIRNAVFARAYGDPTAIAKLAESPDNNVRNITGAMLIAAPRLADIKERIAQGRLFDLDVTGDIAAAMRKLSELRERGEPVEAYLQQQSMFGEEELSPFGKELLRAFSKYATSRKKVTELLHAYADAVEAAGDPSQGTLFGERAAPSKRETLEAALQAMEVRYGEQGVQASLFGGAGPSVRGQAPGAPSAGEVGARGEGAAGREPDLLKQKVQELNQSLGMARAAEEKFGGPGILSGISREAQFVADVAREVRERRSTRVSDEDVERVLSATRTPRNIVEQAKAAVREVGDAIKDMFVYEWRLSEFPRFQDELRRFQGVTRDAQVSALETYKAVVGHLTNPREFEIFRKLIYLYDFKAGLEAEEPETAPGGLTLEQVNKAIEELEAKANENVKAALKAHDEVFKAAWEELKRRGKVSPETEAREHYVPHRVMDYVQNLDRAFPAVARRFKTPYRYYLKERRGSARLIDTDYTTVTLRHFTKLYIDNATDDFAEQIASEWDKWPKLSQEQREKIGEPVPGRLYEIDGKRYLGWQYDPGRQIYPADTYTARAILEICQRVMGEDVTEAQIQTLLDTHPSKLTQEQRELKAHLVGLVKEKAKEVPALGGYKKVYLLPEEIALRLTRLKEPAIKYHTLELARGALQRWKNVVLGPFGAGIPFQVQNAIGDMFNLLRDDPAALLLVGRGWKVAGAWQRGEVPEQYRRLVELAEKTRVLESGLMRKGGVPYDPIMAKLEPARHLTRRLDPFRYSTLSERRELSVRLAKLMKDLERIDQGKMPVAQYTDVRKLAAEGLGPDEIAGKIAREFTVDYGKLTPEQKAVFRDLIWQFSTFYVQNFQNWASYVRRNPKNFILKFLIPLGALALYNWLRFPETEKKLPAYYRVMPHLITGYETPDGKPIVIAFQTPLDQAAKLVGLEITGDLARQVLAGEKGIDEAAKELAKHVLGAVPRAAWEQLNPFFKAPIEAAMNKNTFTGRPIVPERLKGSDEEQKMKLRYVLQQWFAPVAPYVRAARSPEPEKELGKWLVEGPADIKRALGIREADTDREIIDRFYARLEELEGDYAEWRDRFERGQRPPLPQNMAELMALRRVANAFTDEWQIIRRIQANERLPADERERMVAARLRTMARIAERFVK